MQRKIIAIWTILMVAACTNQDEKVRQEMSEKSGLCIALPKESSYEHSQRSFDYDVGRLKLGGKIIEVYIGYQPNFKGERWARGSAPTNGFVYVGREKDGEIDRLLLGNKRSVSRGPIFVMFTADELASVEPTLTEKDFIVDCVKKGASATSIDNK